MRPSDIDLCHAHNTHVSHNSHNLLSPDAFHNSTPRPHDTCRCKQVQRVVRAVGAEDDHFVLPGVPLQPLPRGPQAHWRPGLAHQPSPSRGLAPELTGPQQFAPNLNQTPQGAGKTRSPRTRFVLAIAACCLLYHKWAKPSGIVLRAAVAVWWHRGYVKCAMWRCVCCE